MPVSPETSESLAIVGLGANLGTPVRTMAEAAAALFALSVRPASVAALYLSAPIGPVQPEFYNSAVLLHWPGQLADLLAETAALECRFGRERNEHWGPRTLDLDLLWAGSRQSQTPHLTVPHPELCHRAFALLPLLDLVPGARAPGAGSSYRDVLALVRSQRISRVSGPEWLGATLRP